MEGGCLSLEERRQWLALSRINGLGAAGAETIIQQAGSLSALFNACPNELRDAGLPPVLLSALRQPDWPAVDKACRWQEAAPGRHIICLPEEAYPASLRQIPDPPLVLFAEGRLNVLGRLQVAMVGSRNPTPNGLNTAAELAGWLTRHGVIITSGLALGIDAAAHQGALEAGGETIAVTGCGPDRVYPRVNRQLHERIRSHGLLVSEFFPGMPPLAANFPRRNRVISGLSVGVTVVEAAVRSGSLITARYAAEQGRDVFAVPGSIHNPLARGCHRLIKEGAKLVESHEDVLEELPVQDSLMPLAEGSDRLAETANSTVDLSIECMQVLDLMDAAPVSVDQLVERSGLTADAVSSILLLLELRGLVASQPGGTYSRLQQR